MPVVASGRRDEEGKALVAELRALGAKGECIRADVSVEHDVRALVDGHRQNLRQARCRRQ
ncbi:hypothetical protein HEP87_64490 [Streptomyces sp. S1D4-11]